MKPTQDCCVKKLTAAENAAAAIKEMLLGRSYSVVHLWQFRENFPETCSLPDLILDTGASFPCRTALKCIALHLVCWTVQSLLSC